MRNFLGLGGSTATVALLRDSQLDTLGFGKRNQGLGAMAKDKHIADTGGELALENVLNVNDLEAANVPLTMSDDADTSHIAPASDGSDVANLKLDKLFDLAGLKIEADSVVDLDKRVRVADGTTVVGYEVRDGPSAKLDLLDLEEFVPSFLGTDAVNGEAPLDIVDQAEVLASLLDGDNILEPSRVRDISPNFAIDFD